MFKKIALISFLVLLMAVPWGRIDAATQYYIGVTMSSGQAPGYAPSGTQPTDSNWCLGNGTTIAIQNNFGNNLTPVSPTTNPTQLSSVVCAGTTMWSGLFNLTSGNTYQVYIVPMANNPSYGSYYYSYCPGFYDGSTCWVSWAPSKSCVDTCSHYATTPYLYYGYAYNFQSTFTDANCAVESFLMGGTCATCNAGATYDDYNPTTRVCDYSQNYQSPDLNGSSNLGSSLTRVCACNLQNIYSPINSNFTFSFTPSF